MRKSGPKLVPMARNSAAAAAIRSVAHLRNLLGGELCSKTLTTTTTSSSSFPFPSPSPSSSWLLQQQLNLHHRCSHRCFCSSPTSSSSGIKLLKSEHDFKTSLTKAQDDQQPAVFYFTAAWCGPCKLISPIVEDLSKKYNQVDIYKIDVDEKELQSTLSNLKIYSVPTLQFFHNGKKAGEVVGADVALLKKTMEDLYK